MKTDKKTTINEYSEILKALGHPVRLKIVCGLVKKETCNVGTIVEKLSIPQPTISQHLNILKNAGIVTGYRKGTQVCYKIENAEVIKIIENMDINFCGEKLI